MRSANVKMVLPFAILSAAAFLSGCPGHADPALSAEQISNRAKPETVIVAAKFDIEVDVAELDFDARLLVNDAQAAFGERELSRDEAFKSILSLLLKRPARYMHAGKDRRKLSAKLYSRGTGFIITPNGYLLTNAHVVEPDEGALRLKAAESLGELVKSDADEMNKLVDQLLPGRVMTDETKATFIRSLAQEYVKNGTFSHTREVNAIMGYTEADGKVEPSVRRCDVLKVGKPESGTDVAVARILGEGDLPTVPITPGSVDTVRTGSEVFIVGYPGALAIDPAFKLSSRLDSSLSVGRVNGFKEMSDGAKVIQTDATVNPGNSGSPAFDALGQTIGLATFTVNDGDGSTRSVNLNFVVSIDAARPFLAELKVAPKMSAFTLRYLEGLRQYEAHHDARALETFRQLSDQRPDVIAIRDLVNQLGKGVNSAEAKPLVTQSERPVGKSVPVRKTPGPMLIFGIIAAAIFVVVALVIIVNRNN